MSDETLNRPAEVTFDDHGIEAWLNGALNYYIRWDEIRTIQIDVIGYGDVGAEAFWAIDGDRRSSSPVFFAPVELVVGGNDLTARLRSITGFDDAAFQRAMAAQERGEAGTFLCWRRT